MKRTDANYHVGNLFQSGNPLTGQRGTRLDHTWLNNVQEELAGPILAAGIDLDGGDTTQLLRALRRLGLGYDTLADAQADVVAGAVAPGKVVLVQNHAVSGDNGGFVGVIETNDAPHYPGGGRIKPLGNEVMPEWWGAPVNFSGDAGPGFHAAFVYLAYIGGGTLRAKNGYSILTTVVIPNPTQITVEATGADFDTPDDILMFDCNGLADPTYRTNESVQNFWWRGGYFTCTFANPTKATALRLFGFRNAGLSEAHFAGFRRAVDFSGKDTVKFRDLKFFNNHEDLYNSPWSQVGGLLLMDFSGLHFSHASAGPALAISEGAADITIDRISVNMSSGSSGTGIQVLRQISLYADSLIGSFVIDETIIGNTSGATMTLVRQFTHAHPFEVAQSPYRLLGKDRSATRFAEGETVTGTTSGATAVLPSTGTHGQYAPILIADQPPAQNITIGPGNHFEAGSLASGAVGIRILDLVGRGAPLLYVDIDAGSSGINGGGAVGVVVDATNVRIKGRFAQTDGDGIPIRLGENCKRIHIAEPTFFSNAGIDLYCPRSEVTFDREIELFPGDVLAGFNGLFLSNGAEYVIDVPAALPGYENNQRGGLHPKAARLRVFLAVDGAATDTSNIRLDFRPEGSSPSFDQRAGVSFHNVPAGSSNYGDVEVALDGNGKARLRALVSATCTVKIAVSSLIW